MTTVLFASPSRPPFVQAPPQRFFGLRIVWTGWDGSRWDLTDPTSGIIADSDGGLVGLHFPEFEKRSSKSPAKAGRRSRGSRTNERTVEIPVLIYADGSEEWMALYRAFFDSFDPDRPGVLSVESPFKTAGVIGQTRELVLTLESDGGHAFDHDPVMAGWYKFSLNLTADNPHWYGDPIEYSWEKVDPGLLFVPPGPPFTIVSSSGLEEATMSNPGNVSAWVRWELTATAGAMRATVSVDGGAFQTPSIPAGQTLTVDTDPASEASDLNGVDVDGLMDPWDPAEVPPGQTVPVSLIMTGFGTIKAWVRPPYFRAFG